MFECLTAMSTPEVNILSSMFLAGIFSSIQGYLLIFLGFSLVIFVHELGHFLAAKWCDVRVDRFAIGFGRELFGFTKGETRYSFNLLPLGGYVKMMGQDDFAVDKEGELQTSDDPRSYINKPVRQRMLIVSAGVVMNLVFAALAFMVVFMAGMESLPASVGRLRPDSPAQRSGLQIGDRVVELNGRGISDYKDLQVGITLADPNESLNLTVRRPQEGKEKYTREKITLQPEKDPELGRLVIGIEPPMTNEIAMAIEDPNLRPEEQVEKGDIVLSVSGEKVDSFYDIWPLLVSKKGEYADMRIRRNVPDKKESVEKQVKWRANMLFNSTGLAGKGKGNLLGLVPRRQILQVPPESIAAQAGLQGRDVIVRWGNQVAPTLEEIQKSIKANPNTDIPVVVLRREPGKSNRKVDLTIRPKLSTFNVAGEPEIGIDPMMFMQEANEIVVSDIVSEVMTDIKTPAAALKEMMPRGAHITKVNAEPVKNWYELAQRFVESSGNEVKLTWTNQGAETQTGTIYIPETIGTTFDLSPNDKITKIDGKEWIEVERNGKRRVFSADSWIGSHYILKENVGETIEIEYRGYDAPPEVVKLEVTPEMLNTWVQRIEYLVLDLRPEYKRIIVQETNPLKAMMIGINKTIFFVQSVYVMGQRMIFSRSVDFEQVGGPARIVAMGKEAASHSMPLLLYFLAMISANLAVINFLPVPILDGGVMVFLIIEKIKGSPISLDVQMVTTFIGLVLIIGIFLVVTFNDIVWLFS